MLKKRLIIVLTFLDGVLFRTKNFIPDYRYTKNFIDLWSIDELILIDISKKKFNKEFLDVVFYFSNNCFVPISVGGGIKNIKDADLYFQMGADKIVLGSNSIINENLIKDVSLKYGNQSIIQTLDCKKIDTKKIDYRLTKNSGKEITNIDPLNFAQKVEKIGVGEILINSVDNDGGLLGYDLELIKIISNSVNCPIIALGGAGNWQHILDLFFNTNISAACTQNIFHFTEQSISSAKSFLKKNNIIIRN